MRGRFLTIFSIIFLAVLLFGYRGGQWGLPLNKAGLFAEGNVAGCGAPATLVHEFSGLGASSPRFGESVTVEGVVIGDYQSGDGDEFGTNLGGYFLQEEDEDADADPLTPESIYVHDSSYPVAVGDLVRVTGTLGEHGGLLQLQRVQETETCASGVELPAPVPIQFPLAHEGELAPLVGMLITFPQELHISDHHNYGRFGEVTLAWAGEGNERFYQPTHTYGSREDQVREGQRYPLSSILLDDGINDQNPRAVRHPAGGFFTASGGFRAGDTLVNLTGVLDYRYDSYRVQPVAGAEFRRTNPRPDAPAEVGGTLKVATFNVENYFLTTKDAGRVCGPSGRMECRGAADSAERALQRSKVTTALALLDAHVLALVEVENDEGAALTDLIAGLNDLTSPGTYAAVNLHGPAGNDAITVALAYQPDVVAPVGSYALLDTPEFVSPLGAQVGRNRPALAQTFLDLASGERFTVVVNHWKSKASPCGEPDESGPAANCPRTRAAAAAVLLEWLDGDPTGEGGLGYLLMGDLNAYARESPIDALLAGSGLVDLIASFVGPDAYTYLYDGRLGYLDHALASAELARHVTGVTIWHINADEPSVLGYASEMKSPAQLELVTRDPYRSSDHDPVVVGLDLSATH